MVLVPASMGRLNQRALIGCLQRLGVASRADLAKSLGLSQPTAGKIADQLIKVGVIEELGTATGARRRGGRAVATEPKLGRPGRLLRLNETRERFVAVQLGVTETCVALLPLGLAGEDRWAWRFPTPGSAEAWARALHQLTEPLPARRFWGALVSVPGIVDEAAGKVLFSPNLHWTERVNLVELVREVWELPTILVQEERALALGHHATTASAQDFLLVDFGDGVGGAAVTGGKPFAAPLPLSGELGHTPVPGNLRRCGCGAVGCLETLVSERGLLESFAEQQPGASVSLEELRQHVLARGVPGWLAAALDATAAAVAGALNVMGLRQVVFTGTVPELAPAVLADLSQKVVRGAMWGRFGNVECQSAPRHRAAGLVAAGIDRLVAPIGRARHAAKSLLPHV